MNGNVLRILFLHELKMLVRARRTVVIAIVLPAVIMPLMLYAQKYSADRRERLLTGSVYRFAISGESADRIRQLINQTRRNINLEQGEDVEALRQFRFVESSVVDARASLDKDEIQLYLDAAGPAVTTSVGAYQLEGLGVHLFERIEGDHFTILGLPLLPLLQGLRSIGLVAE